MTKQLIYLNQLLQVSLHAIHSERGVALLPILDQIRCVADFHDVRVV